MEKEFVFVIYNDVIEEFGKVDESPDPVPFAVA
jgi:hypothetical protein